MNTNTWKLTLLLPILFLLSSCDSGKKVVDLDLRYLPAHTVPVETTDRQAQEQIAEAATAVGQSLQELSAVQMTVHPPQKLQKPFNPRVIGMNKLASISWTGPVKPLLRKIAEATNYQLRVIGKEPNIPVLVSLDIHNQPIADILRNVTYQIVMKANIAVYPKSRTIELRYNGN
ncbi:MAG: type IVB secretion system lipoprotein DotD [Gammaproteobacteria bacterium]|nr:type IVB secretion system lipoprotein DotD [Gammaproteobacteria bacterium]